MSRMPILPVDAMVADCNDSEEKLIRAAFVNRGKNAGRQLRTAKPFHKASNDFEGRANYVWRMLCFDLCDFGQYTCTPITARFDVGAGYKAEHGCKLQYGDVRIVTEELNDLIGQITKVIPIEEQKNFSAGVGLV